MALVLDLDSTLIYSAEVPENSNDYNISFEDGLKYKTILRPHLREFLEFAKEIFDKIIIWSAGKKDYVDKVVNIIKFDFDKVMSFNDCYKTLDKYSDVSEYYFHKPLKEIWKDGIFDRTNTMIIDDRLDVARRNWANHIRIKRYLGEDKDDELRKLKIFIKNNLNIKDIRKLCLIWNCENWGKVKWSKTDFLEQE